MKKAAANLESAEKQLDGFLAAFTPEVEALARAVLEKMRARLPNAVEMVYDNYNALVCGFGPTEEGVACDLFDCDLSEALEFVFPTGRGVARSEGFAAR